MAHYWCLCKIGFHNRQLAWDENMFTVRFPVLNEKNSLHVKADIQNFKCKNSLYMPPKITFHPNLEYFHALLSIKK